jgi:ribosomal protein S18 acetylase RimI-like enzyme
MRKAELKDIQLVTHILSQAFSENMSVNYVVKQDRNRLTRIEKLMQYSFTTCIDFGEVWISENEEGCALLLYPDKIKTTFKSLLRDIKLAVAVIGLERLPLVLRRESWIKKNHPAGAFCHLWFIGVNPGYQKKGCGGDLLKHVIHRAEIKNRPIYLETSVDLNLPWYQRFGFDVFHTIELSYKLYLLRRI